MTHHVFAKPAGRNCMHAKEEEKDSNDTHDFIHVFELSLMMSNCF